MRIHLGSGLGLSYAPSGAGEITLVFLHPVGLRRQMWELAAERLAAGYRCLCLDLPGHGDSDLPSRPLKMKDMAEAVRGVVDTLGGPRVVLVGCSMGSAIAAEVAGAEPERFAGLVLSSASYARAPDRHASLTRRAEAARQGMARIVGPTLERWFSAQAASTRPELVQLARDWLLAGDPVVHSWCWEILRDFEYVPVAPRLALPTLVIAGGDDQSAKPPAVKALADAVEGAEYAELAGAGHLSPLEQPEAFAALVRDFLARRLH